MSLKNIDVHANKIYSLDIYDEYGKKYQPTILPTLIKHDDDNNIIEDNTSFDYSKPVCHMLFDKCVKFRENKYDEWISRKSFYDANGKFNLFFSDIYIEPYFINEVNIYENHGAMSEVPKRYCYHIFVEDKGLKHKITNPMICISYMITDYKPYCEFEYIDMTKQDIQIKHKFNDFGNDFIFHFKPVMYTLKSNVYEDVYCGIETLITGKSEVKINKKKYLLDSENIRGIYCLNIDKSRKEFLCVIELKSC